jgi:hypothetical protein
LVFIAFQLGHFKLIEDHFSFVKVALIKPTFEKFLRNEILKGCTSKVYDKQFQLTATNNRFTFKWSGQIDNIKCMKRTYENINSIQPSTALSYEIPHTNGYHQKMNFNFKPSNDGYLIIEFTNDYFVDQYKVKRLNLAIDVKFIGKIDLETSADHENSRPHLMIIKIDNDVEFDFTLPFHLRYQKPDDLEYVNVEIINPYLVSVIESDKCPFLILPEGVLKHVRSDGKCLERTEFNGDYSLRVPVGDSRLEDKIKMYTFMISIIGVLVVLLALYFPKKSKKEKGREKKKKE